MSLFTDDLTVTQLSGDDRNAWRLWRTETPLVYEAGELGSGREIIVPSGFITDGPSIPQFLWALLPVWGSYSRSGVVHDFLCYRLDKGDPHPEAPTRQAADHIFLESMGALNVNPLIKYAMYLGVRFGTLIGIRTTAIQWNAMSNFHC